MAVDPGSYWKRNLSYVGALLTVWFIASFGFGILFVDALDEYRFGGFKLGFWFAQQGSIYIFIVLVFTYSFLMARLERRKRSEDSSESEEKE